MGVMEIVDCRCTILNPYFSSDIKGTLSEPGLKIAETVFSRNRSVFITLSRLKEVDLPKLFNR